MLLQERDLLPQPAQRIAAVFLLLELYHSEPVSSNPFATFLAELLKVMELLCKMSSCIVYCSPVLKMSVQQLDYLVDIIYPQLKFTLLLS